MRHGNRQKKHRKKMSNEEWIALGCVIVLVVAIVVWYILKIRSRIVTSDFSYSNDDAQSPDIKINNKMERLISELQQADGTESTTFLQRYSDIVIEAKNNYVPMHKIDAFGVSFMMVFNGKKFQDMDFYKEKNAFNDLIKYNTSTNTLSQEELKEQKLRISSKSKGASSTDMIRFVQSFKDETYDVQESDEYVSSDDE